MSTDQSFTAENLDIYLRDLAKEYKKHGGKYMKAEIILIGGAAILANYGFRQMTYDMDALIEASSAIDDAINAVGNRHGLPVGWLNSDFRNTKSYSPKLRQYSQHYKQFYGILEVRIVTAEYLVAMKLVSSRQYKNDLSDIIGIIAEHRRSGTPLTYEQIDTAVCNLYGSWESIPNSSVGFIKSALLEEDIESLYVKSRESEIENRDALIEFDAEYPGSIQENNISELIAIAKKRQQEKRS